MTSHYPNAEYVRRLTLPGLALSQLPEGLQKLTCQIVDRLGISIGRVLFNIQRYSSGNKPVPLHFDGDFFEYTTNPDGTFSVIKGIRPKQVAVLTLQNDTNGGGTILSKNYNSPNETVKAGAGDLLIFDNANQLHGVAALTPKVSVCVTGYIRYVIGWRSFEDQCLYISSNEPIREITPDEAAQIHQNFLLSDWPLIRDETLNGLF